MELKIIEADDNEPIRQGLLVGEEVRIQIGDSATLGVYQVNSVEGEALGLNGSRWIYTLSLLRKE